jgi:hypothetical protein
MRATAVNAYSGPGIGVLWAIYLIVGGIVAATHNYWQHVHAWKPIVSGLLATALWPLIFFGINLHIH